MDLKNPKLQKALEDEKVKQSQELVIDFDQSWQEYKSGSIVVKIDGKEYRVPGTMPQWFYVVLVKHKFEVSDEVEKELFDGLFGEGVYEKIYDSDDKFRENFIIDELVNPIINKWFEAMPKGGKKKKTQGS